MNISKTLMKAGLSFFVAVLIFSAGSSALAQTDSVRKKRLRSPAAVTGFVGGEAHDSYVLRARRNQTLRVQISWPGKGRRAQFVVSRSADFFSAETVAGGRETSAGRTWAGKVPATGDYYIYVTAHPTAKYTLKVTVK